MSPEPGISRIPSGGEKHHHFWKTGTFPKIEMVSCQITLSTSQDDQNCSIEGGQDTLISAKPRVINNDVGCCSLRIASETSFGGSEKKIYFFTSTRHARCRPSRVRHECLAQSLSDATHSWLDESVNQQHVGCKTAPQDPILDRNIFYRLLMCVISTEHSSSEALHFVSKRHKIYPLCGLTGFNIACH